MTGIRRVLTVNAGSSSLKLRLLDGDAVVVSSDVPSAGAGFDVDSLQDFTSGSAIDAVGHRVVHGGTRFTAAARLDDEVEQAIRDLTALAPLHQPKSLAGIDAVGALLPGVPAVACFDTAFHADLPEAASTYALPQEWRERWPLRRFGFHGLSHSYASRRAAELADRPLAELRVVVCHLGAGASLCAVQGGRSVDTTMGFTPLEGLVMATRSGSVDPGLLLWLQEQGGLSAHDVTDALEHRSGLLGLGGSADLRALLERDDPVARLAVGVYLHRLVGSVAAMAAAMGGLDVLVFTGGVGEGAAGLRLAVAGRLAFLGVRIDPALNDAAPTDGEVSPPDAPVRSFVVQAREDLEMAREVRAVLAG